MPASPKPRFLSVAATACAALATFLVTPPASASTCYVVLDRADTVIYQSRMPPFDMSSAGANAREALRHRGEFMEMYDAPACPERNALSAAGKGEASVEDIVGTLKPYQRAGRRGTVTETDSQPFAMRDTDRVVVRTY